jgi:Domain of unknown function (DUF4294)
MVLTLYGPEFDTFAENLLVKFISAIVFLCLITTVLSGQNDSVKQAADSLHKRTYILQEVTRDGVTLPEVEIKAVTVYAQPQFAKKRDFRKYERLVYNLKIVYPYALIVRNKLLVVDQELGNYKNERERKEYLKKVEKEVFAEYEGAVRDMTISQGRLLIKLIDRETQNTSYVLIKDYRGKFAAAFWQGIARIFGTNLKEEYDRYGEDAIIESIIEEIDAGRL